MSILSILRESIFGRRKRVKGRNQLHELSKVGVMIDDQRYALQDFTSEGIGFLKDDSRDFDVGKVYQVKFTLYGHASAYVKVKVVRVKDDVIGCKIIDKEKFTKFSSNYLRFLTQSKVSKKA